MEELLTINNLRKGFGGLEVLKDISLHVKKGQVVAIIGPSGSGKSTLLRCATMLETVDEGEIRYGEDVLVHTDGQGKPVYADKATLKKIRSKFGLVFQNFNLFPHFSVLKNITEAQVIAGIDKKQAQEKARELLGKMGLADKEKAYPCQLSGGQQQRVALARTLAQNPQIILADEPVASLDPVTAKQVMDDFQRINRDMRITILINIHHVDLALQYATRVIGIRAGRVVYDGRPVRWTAPSWTPFIRTGRRPRHEPLRQGVPAQSHCTAQRKKRDEAPLPRPTGRRCAFGAHGALC